MKLKVYCFLSLLFISIACLQAQDYLITFAGSGEATTVETVKVQNMTQGTEITMNGNEVLHLMGTITGIETVNDNGTGKIVFYPNPMTDFTKMRFDLPEAGETLISIYDISGRKIVQKKDLLHTGQHTYEIQGIGEGIYIVKINSGSFALNGRLISSGSNRGNAKIVYAGSGETNNLKVSQEKQGDSKGSNAEIVMQYYTGDRLKLTGISGINSTVITDLPIESKTITFDLVPCTDGDGNNYPIVKIGTQIWTADNLKTTKFRDGTDIPNVTDGLLWAGLKTPAYSWYNNDFGNKNDYGALYNWYTVTTDSVCPSGWHVPSTNEWHQLVSFLDTTAVYETKESLIVGNKIKETGIKHWKSPNTDATNEIGFTALPGGLRRHDNGNFSSMSDIGYWWSSSEYSSAYGWFRNVWANYSFINMLNYYKENGFSVRCIKDQVRLEEAFHGVKGEFLDFIINGDTITCEKIDTFFVFEGDIILTEYQLYHSDTTKGAGLPLFSNKWPNNTVYYNISDGAIRDYYHYNIDKAIAHYEQTTPLVFLKRTDQEDYITFINASGNSSSLGKIGGEQFIRLFNSDVGTVIHEIGHAVGLIHEHSRRDRDDSLYIHWENIDPDETKMFRKKTSRYRTPYLDFNSIMLYPSDAFNINGKPTITRRLDGKTYVANRKELSPGDISIINEIYSGPTITTPEIITIKPPRYTNSTITIEGKIVSDGGAKVTERGFYWGPSAAPEINGTKVQVGYGLGSFSTNLQQLAPETTYYVKAYGRNSQGIAYGSQEKFMTLTEVQTGTLTDSRDGKVYKTVKIGTQWWMAENLSYLPSVSPSSKGSNTEPYYYVYDYQGSDVGEAKATTNYQTYGVLYNWPAAMNSAASSTANPSGVKGVCPTGWHLPSDMEWTELENYLISNGYNYDGTNTGNKIAKSLATTEGWLFTTNIGAVGNTDYPNKRNITGFSALPGGRRYYGGWFWDYLSHGIWWSSTEYSDMYSIYRYLKFPYSELYQNYQFKENGYSVRCLKD